MPLVEGRTFNINKILGGLHMLRRTLLATAAATAMIAGVAHADGHEPLKVGFVYVGPIGDGGWTYEHDKGRLAV
jgi:basic membrane protein A